MDVRITPEPEERDADVLELLGQAEQLGIEDVQLLPDARLGKLDPSVWMEGKGYPRAERKDEDR